MTTEVVAAEGAVAQVSDVDRPYAPSWVDLITSAIERLPGPTWLAYIVLLFIACFMASTEGWVAGITTFPAIDLAQASYGLFFIAPLAVMHYLDHVAGDAWDQFRPATDLNDRAAARVRYELTVTPARPALVLLVLGYLANTAWYAADPVGTQIAGHPVLFVVMRAFFEGFHLGRPVRARLSHGATAAPGQPIAQVGGNHRPVPALCPACDVALDGA